MMTAAEKYCARKVAGKLTKAIVLLEEAKEAAKAMSPEAVASLESNHLVPALRDLVLTAAEVRRGITPRLAQEPPFVPAIVVKHG